MSLAAILIFCFNFVQLSCKWLCFVSHVFEINEDTIQYKAMSKTNKRVLIHPENQQTKQVQCI